MLNYKKGYSSEIMVLVDKKDALKVETQKADRDGTLWTVGIKPLYFAEKSKTWEYARGGAQVPADKSIITELSKALSAALADAEKRNKDMPKNGAVKTFTPDMLAAVVKSMSPAERKAFVAAVKAGK